MVARDGNNRFCCKVFKETKGEIPYLPCCLAPQRWKRESVKRKEESGFLLAAIIVSLVANKPCKIAVFIYNPVSDNLSGDKK